MAALGQAKVFLALLVATLLLWKPTIVVMFPGFIYTSDLSSVLLADSCINCSAQTVFVFCLLEVLIACVLLNAYVIPALFGRERWQSMDSLKQRKLVGFLVKILARIACAVQIIVLVAPRFDLQTGLFSSFNVKREIVEVHDKHFVRTCEDAGMTLGDAAALRAWTFARDDMMAVMVWELAFIPELPTDAWLHHLFVILGVTFTSDGQLLGSRAPVQPLIDGYSFFLALGAALAALVEAAVLMYHLNYKCPATQARWMIRSMAVQAAIVLVFFVALPGWVALAHFQELGGLAYGVMALLIFLATVEGKMIIVKWAIVKSARRKARLQASLILGGAGPAAAEEDNRLQRLGGSFSHDLSKDVDSSAASTSPAETPTASVSASELGEASALPQQLA